MFLAKSQNYTHSCEGVGICAEDKKPYNRACSVAFPATVSAHEPEALASRRRREPMARPPGVAPPHRECH